MVARGSPTTDRMNLRVVKLVSGRRSPWAQLAAAVLVMCGGGSLIGLWMVGLVLIFAGLLCAVDAVLRDVQPRHGRDTGSHDQVLERWKHAR
jgi:hypothetical protein